jgi:hypothetical protein
MSCLNGKAPARAVRSHFPLIVTPEPNITAGEHKIMQHARWKFTSHGGPQKLAKMIVWYDDCKIDNQLFMLYIYIYMCVCVCACVRACVRVRITLNPSKCEEEIQEGQN